MSVRRILVLGGGFAGLWSAVGAARELDRQGIGSKNVEVTLLNRDAFHSIRVRNYEADLTPIRVPLDDVLEPIGVRRAEGIVEKIDFAKQLVVAKLADETRTLPYDRLVFALGSQLFRPNIPGLAQWAFDVDTYGSAVKLRDHLSALPTQADSPGMFTVIVVGAGLTGIETAAEMPARLRAMMASSNIHQPFRVILADHQTQVGSDMGDSARPVIEKALASLGVEIRLGIEVAAVSQSGIKLKGGEEILASTVVWCAGMRASPLTQSFPVVRDHFGRLPVDESMKVSGLTNVFAAGDSALARIDGQRGSVMSCQHGRPMGRFAGHNVVCDLLGLPMLPLQIPWYVTVLDLGAWGAVYTQGWERHVVSEGAAAKKTKQIINCERIYPPLNRNRADILAAGAPVVQSAPESYQPSFAGVFRDDPELHKIRDEIYRARDGQPRS